MVYDARRAAAPCAREPHREHHVDRRQGRGAAPGAVQLREVRGSRVLQKACARSCASSGFRLRRSPRTDADGGRMSSAHSKVTWIGKRRCSAWRPASRWSRWTPIGRILTPQANLVARFFDLLPGLTTEILAMVNRLLPHSRDTDRRVRGADTAALRNPLINALTIMGRTAARRFLQPV